MIFPDGLEGVIPIQPGSTVTRGFALTGRRYTIAISRDVSGFYDMALDEITETPSHPVIHVSEVLTENDLDKIYQETISKIGGRSEKKQADP